jgi:peptide/nickel transport system substrate-binding protein
VKRSRLSVIVGLVLAVVVFLSGCGGSEPDTGPKQADKTIVVGIKQSIDSLDPALYRDRVSETVVRNMFDGLVTRTPDMEIVPEIAESWENPSPTEWVFKIREGVTFHNGDPLTADDVVYSFERILKPGSIDGQSSPRTGMVGPMERVEKLDEYTVKFIFKEPWPIFLRILPHHQIVPKKYIEEHGSAYFAQNPIGAGPFRFVRGSLDEEIVMERYDDYYGGSPDLPPVGPAPAKTAVFKILPETATRVSALQAGEVHIVHAIPPHLVEQLTADPNVEVKTATGTRVFFLELNVTKKPLDDVRVRRAINHAINWDSIIDNVLEGYAIRSPGPAIPGSFGYNDQIKGYEYSPDKARQLLAEAGQAGGFNLIIDCESEFKDVTEAIAQQLNEVGIEATVRVWDGGVLKPLLREGERQAAFGSWGNSTMEPYDLFEPKLSPKERGNYSQYSSPEFDALLARASVTTDEAARAEIYRQIQQLIFDDAPWAFGYTSQEIEACQANVVNWTASPDNRINLHDVDLN